MRLAILGASGHGKVVADIAFLQGYDDVVFFDDNCSLEGRIGGFPLCGTTETLLSSIIAFDAVIVGIGDNAIRTIKNALLAAADAPLVTLAHPSAVVSSSVQIGLGSLVCAGSVVNVNTVMGASVIVNTGATVDHDCRLADGAHVAPGATISGDVHVGEQTLIGIGACVKPGIRIGSRVIVGAGAVVVSDIPDNTVFAGNPARPMASK